MVFCFCCVCLQNCCQQFLKSQGQDGTEPKSTWFWSGYRCIPMDYLYRWIHPSFTFIFSEKHGIKKVHARLFFRFKLKVQKRKQCQKYRPDSFYCLKYENTKPQQDNKRHIWIYVHRSAKIGENQLFKFPAPYFICISEGFYPPTQRRLEARFLLLLLKDSSFTSTVCFRRHWSVAALMLTPLANAGQLRTTVFKGLLH